MEQSLHPGATPLPARLRRKLAPAQTLGADERQVLRLSPSVWSCTLLHNCTFQTRTHALLIMPAPPALCSGLSAPSQQLVAPLSVLTQHLVTLIGGFKGLGFMGRVLGVQSTGRLDLSLWMKSRLTIPGRCSNLIFASSLAQ